MEGLYFDKNEIIHIVISVLAISLGFTIVFAGIGGLLSSPREFIAFMILSLVTVGSGFILHEMGHKLVAIYYGASARFIMWTNGLILMLVTSLFGVLFAAPGAVYIYSNKITKTENGIISLVGPMINLGLTFFFILLNFIAPITQYFTFLAARGLDIHGFGITNGGLLHVWIFGAAINLMLGLFNMIPAFPLDGSKVFAWNKPVWAVLILFMLGFGSILISPSIIISFGLLLIIALVFSKLAFG